jgi:hypothetical protein
MFVKGDTFGVGYVAVVLNTGSEVGGATHFKGHLWRRRDRTSRVYYRPRQRARTTARGLGSGGKGAENGPLKPPFSATFFTGTETYAEHIGPDLRPRHNTPCRRHEPRASESTLTVRFPRRLSTLRRRE